MRALWLAIALQAAPLLVPAAAEDTWRLEAAGHVGALLSPGVIGRDTNATGREELRAILSDGPVLGLRIGWASPFLGLEVETARALARVEVRSEHGVDFPNHGEAPFLLSAQLVLYPAGDKLWGGRLRPHLLAGLGGMLVSVDLDNVGGQRHEFASTRILGAGLRFSLRPNGDVERFLDLRATRSTVAGSSPLDSFELESLSVSYVARL